MRSIDHAEFVHFPSNRNSEHGAVLLPDFRNSGNTTTTTLTTTPILTPVSTTNTTITTTTTTTTTTVNRAP
ncbi:hypothetical protein E2C01_047825 [Portunus trituberculatus]|uniref:Uncharacterized protein n=1 Tax=Portunus trituberculatus TaxID=210409 RepID=A0A5B7G4L7_PORTR|nr:hypothetical protein [Portunus trituberculatus]